MSSTRVGYTASVNLEIIEQPNWDYLRAVRLRRVLTWYVYIISFWLGSVLNTHGNVPRLPYISL